MEPRYKNILCDVSSGFDVEFMLDDEEGTVYSDYEFYAVRDEFFEDDLKAAKAHSITFFNIWNPETSEIETIDLDKYEQNK